MDYLGKDGHEFLSLNSIWGVCEDTANVLTACAAVCERVSLSKGYPVSVSQRPIGYG